MPELADRVYYVCSKSSRTLWHLAEVGQGWTSVKTLCGRTLQDPFTIFLPLGAHLPRCPCCKAQADYEQVNASLTARVAKQKERDEAREQQHKAMLAALLAHLQATLPAVWPGVDVLEVMDWGRVTLSLPDPDGGAPWRFDVSVKMNSPVQY